MSHVTGTFVYFAYGSNMLSRRLKAKDRAPSAIAIRNLWRESTEYVASRRLTFDKVSSDGSGKCDIESTANSTDRVYGVLFKVSCADKRNLDCAEGRGKGYEEEPVRVVTPNGEEQEAITCVATKKEPALRPYHWYKALVVAGAIEHELPPDYIEWLRTFDSQPDPNHERRAKEEFLLLQQLTKRSGRTWTGT